MTTTAAAPASEARAGSEALQALALRFRQKQPEVTLYVTALPARELLGRCRADVYRHGGSGYQRPPMRSRLRQLSAYLRLEEGALPTSLLLCIRRPDRADFQPLAAGPSSAQPGTITIGPGVTLWVVDGQHRLAGLEWALSRDGAAWLADYTLPVTIVEGMDAYQEMRYFHIINTRQKGVPTDVVDRHLLAMREAEGPALLEREGERSYLRARATKLCDLLNSHPESPWRGMIRMPGQPARPQHTVRQHSMVSSLEPVVRDPLFQRLADDAAGKLLLNFWGAARDCWPSAFQSPQEYAIQRPLGAGALHQLFPDVLELCRAADDFSQRRMAQVLAEMGRTAGFWHLQRGHHLVRQSGSRYVRALAEYLRDRLPRPVLRRL